MGCGCCSRNSDVTEPVKKMPEEEILENNNILDSPFTKEARRERDGTLKQGQIPKEVSNVYDKIAEEQNYVDINESFTANPIHTNPFMEPWKEVEVSPSKYLIREGVYYQPPLQDIQPVYITDMAQGRLAIYNISSEKIIHYENKIFLQSARAIYLPIGVILICGGKNARSCYSFDPVKGKIDKLDSLFEGREYHSVAYVDKYVIVSGGLGYEELNSCELYFNGKWSSTGSLNYARSMHSSIGLEKCIYVFGGMKQKTIEKWEDGIWKVLALNLEYSIGRIGISPINAYKILIVGGERSGIGYSLKAWEVDINKIKIIPLADITNVGLFESCGSFYNEKSFFLMGENRYIYNVSQKSWEYS